MLVNTISSVAIFVKFGLGRTRCSSSSPCPGENFSRFAALMLSADHEGGDSRDYCAREGRTLQPISRKRHLRAEGPKASMAERVSGELGPLKKEADSHLQA